MIEILLLSLNLTDEQLYNKVNIYQTIFDQLTEINNEFDIAIIGPKKFDLKENQIYPLFSTWKTNNYDNNIFVPPNNAIILITQVETNQLTVIQLSNNTNKLPYPEKKTEPVYPPGYNPNVKRYSFGKICREIASRDFFWIDGHYTIQIICGKMFSNVISITVSGTSIKPENVLIKNSVEPIFNDALQKVKYEKNKNSPPIPVKTNNIEIITNNEGKKTLLYGSFNLPVSIVKNGFSVEISIIVQYSSENGFIHEKIDIPVKYATKDEHEIKGFFSYDLYNLFFNKYTNKINMPEVVLVNAVSGKVISNMIELVNKESE